MLEEERIKIKRGNRKGKIVSEENKKMIKILTSEQKWDGKDPDMLTMVKKLIHLMTKVLVPVLIFAHPFPLSPFQRLQPRERFGEGGMSWERVGVQTVGYVLNPG